MLNEKSVSGTDIPLGLGMAFAQNTAAMKYFSSLSTDEQHSIIEKAKMVSSKSEMHAFVSELGAK